jgi:hypothetical protein
MILQNIVSLQQTTQLRIITPRSLYSPSSVLCYASSCTVLLKLYNCYYVKCIKARLQNVPALCVVQECVTISTLSTLVR